MEADASITRLLEAWTGDNRAALDALMPSVVEELKGIASACLAREPHAGTLQTTALVNEAYLRLVNVRPRKWESRGQFYALTAQIMRRILVDHARARLTARRGRGSPAVPLEEIGRENTSASEALLGLDDALLSLEKLDPRKARLVEMRIFGGLSNLESAEALGISQRTVIREWQFTKAWLARELNYTLREEE